MTGALSLMKELDVKFHFHRTIKSTMNARKMVDPVFLGASLRVEDGVRAKTVSKVCLPHY